jgi:hypothetical protein
VDEFDEDAAVFFTAFGDFVLLAGVVEFAEDAAVFFTAFGGFAGVVEFAKDAGGAFTVFGTFVLLAGVVVEAYPLFLSQFQVVEAVVVDGIAADDAAVFFTRAEVVDVFIFFFFFLYFFLPQFHLSFVDEDVVFALITVLFTLVFVEEELRVDDVFVFFGGSNTLSFWLVVSADTFAVEEVPESLSLPSCFSTSTENGMIISMGL